MYHRIFKTHGCDLHTSTGWETLQAWHEDKKSQFPQRALSQMYGCACEVGIGDAAAPRPRWVSWEVNVENWENKHIRKSYKQNNTSQNMQYVCICEITELD